MAKAERENPPRPVQHSRLGSDWAAGFYLIERMAGPVLTTDEAKKILAPYGKVKTCYPASPLERTALRLNEGVLVSFEMYDMGQTALQVRSPPLAITSQR
jgi:hypothetical protein